MNWTAIRPVIKTLISDLSGIQTLWQDEPRPFTNTAFCILEIISNVGQGHDECRTEQDLTALQGEEKQDVWIGNRHLTLSIKAESEIQTDDGNAYRYLEQIRNRLVFRSSRATLRAVNVAVLEIMATQNLPAIRDERWRSIASLDVMLAVRNLTIDPVRHGYIATVDITGHLQPGNPPFNINGPGE